MTDSVLASRRRGWVRGRAARLKPRIIARDRCCQYCGRGGELTVDHVHPVSLGGETNMGNLVACCLGCNYYKADLLPLEYFWAWGATPKPAPKPRAKKATRGSTTAALFHPRLSAYA